MPKAGRNAASIGAGSRLAWQLRTPPHPPPEPPPVRSQCPAGPGRGSGSPVVSLASGPHLPVSKPPTPGPGVPAPAPRVMLREGGGCGSPEGVRVGGGGIVPAARSSRRRARSAWMEGLWRGSPGTPVSTHPSPAWSQQQRQQRRRRRWLRGPGAPGWEMLASAAVSRPIPGSGGGCSGLQASRASRPRARPLSPPPAPPPPLPAVQAGPPGCTLGRGAGEGPLGRRAWGEKRAEARPERGEQRCRLPLGSAASDPGPPPTGAPSPLFAAPRWAWRGGRRSCGYR